MKEGDVLLASLLQADGGIKNRPVVALRQMPRFEDWLVCGVSTQLQQETTGFDIVIRPGDADFRASGLKAASVIRLGFLAVLPKPNLLGAIGSISKERHRELLRRLSAYLTPR